MKKMKKKTAPRKGAKKKAKKSGILEKKLGKKISRIKAHLKKSKTDRQSAIRLAQLEQRLAG